MKTVCYYGHDWAGNIGNAFIDYSLRYCLKSILDESEYVLYEASNLPAAIKYNYGIRKPFSLVGNKPSKFDLRTLMNPDYVILGGSLLDFFWSKIHKDFMLWLAEKKVKVIICGGGGGNSYSKEEIELVKKKWQDLDVVAFIARDFRVYDNYKDFFPNSYAGIDNAFFLKDCFKPAPLSIPNLGIKAFDLTLNKDVVFPNGYNVVTLGHRLMDVDSFKYAYRHGWKTFSIVSDYDMISDFPDDYLHLYGNSQLTLSDRVHACVATLSFGGQARYYDKSDRSYLFERVGLSNINKEIVCLDQKYISEEKNKQLAFLKSIFY